MIKLVLFKKKNIFFKKNYIKKNFFFKNLWFNFKYNYKNINNILIFFFLKVFNKIEIKNFLFNIFYFKNFILNTLNFKKYKKVFIKIF